MGIEKGRISWSQVIFLTANTILASMVLITPAFLTGTAGQDAWLAVLVAGFFGIVFGLVVFSLGRRFSHKNLVEYSIDLVGPWAGRLLGIVFGLFFLYLNSYIVRSFGDMLVTEAMPETPLVVFTILMVGLAAYGVYLGLEVFSRVNEIIFPLSVLIAVVFIGLGIPDMDFYQLKPLFERSFFDVLRGAMILFGFFAEGAFLLMIFPNLQTSGQDRKIVLAVSLILTITMLVDVVGLIALFGYEETSRFLFPSFELAKSVHLGIFIDRLESLVVGVWVATISLKVMVFYYISVLTFAEVFGLKDYRPLVLPFAFLLTGISVLGWSNSNQVRIFLQYYFPLLSINVLGGITLLLYIVSFWRRGKSEKGGGKNEEGAFPQD
ncbi:spore germination protein KB [Thermacetogenium phaeum DSM 12270]|uniref:Spore germination protein KB n=1 Tax=Thermacetogenium phaeum (strain ATCC BAA-254 / DSM 26808 / PB) TaxID=1089553 RepID=K4LE12_THEPS|nr:endospore germination permease [Thermacetogenium phaeum]AFV11108.1 spore germination protein KB [Thermacetogenium phaeum DSM 12270]